MVMPSKPKFTEDQYVQLEKYGAIGLPQKHIAALFDMAEATFERILNRDPLAKEALSKGTAKAMGKVLNTAFDMATSGKQPAMTMFYLKCRLRWSEPRAIADDDGAEDSKDNCFLMNYKK
jgi:hypothetical protein